MDIKIERRVFRIELIACRVGNLKLAAVDLHAKVGIGGHERSKLIAPASFSHHHWDVVRVLGGDVEIELLTRVDFIQ